MEATEKLTKNWKKELWTSVDEQDVMQLRSKLKDICNQAQNELKSYNMNCAEDIESIT